MSASIPLPPVVQGDADYRSYRPVALPNGLVLLLAHDPTSRHVAAAVSVRAGASADPRCLPGLAHFCEHMCFLGSRAYPEENAYKRYLARHGGRSNASTGMAHTTYQFEVLANFGEKALDVFSHFFISPLFTESGTRREVQAVDSENSKNLVNDGRRRLQVLKSLADPRHHYSKFSTGNRFTLPAAGKDAAGKDAASEPGGDNASLLSDILAEIGDGERAAAVDEAELVRAALLAFHEFHYRPENMSAVVVGPQSLDELESWAAPLLGRIPDRAKKDEGVDAAGEDEGAVGERQQRTRRAVAREVEEAAKDAPPVSARAAVAPDPAFRPDLQGGTWPVVVTAKPLKAVRKLEMLFPLPPTWRALDRSPVGLLSHLFGHEGPGSPFAALQDKGLVTSLSAGNRVSGPDQALFKIGTTLTAEGEARWKEVVQHIFDYGSLVRRTAERSLKATGDAEADISDASGDELRRIWGEVAALSRIRFHQTSPGAAYRFAPAAAQSISVHGTSEFLSTGSRLHETRDSLPLVETLEYCARIVPSNCVIERSSEAAFEEMESRYPCGAESGGAQFAFGRRRERWYGVEYFVAPVDKEDIMRWETPTDRVALHLPTPNRYIPRSLALCEELPEEARVQRIEIPIQPPKLIVNKPDCRLWHKLDDRYALPKASVKVLIRTAAAENKLRPVVDRSSQPRWEYDAETAMQSKFLTNVFSNALAQDTYDAYLAGLSWSLSASSSGLTLSCSGYSDRLTDFALKLLTDFCQGKPFLKESHFITAKDKIVRGLKGYFESSRADTLAFHYRNLLLSSKGGGVENNLELAEGMTLTDVAHQQRDIWADKSAVVDVFYTGNVSQKEANSFFDQAMDILDKTRSEVVESRPEQVKYSPWVPGPFERRLPPEDDIELHFASKNPKEENGAVVVTYQSQLEGWSGKSLSTQECLERSAAIRLLCKMIKEPLFNELRTKQQLGYIVSSYYDVDYSSRQPDFFHSNTSSTNNAAHQVPLTTCIDSLVVYVLSRKEEPIEVARRIDDFLVNFRSRLEDMRPTEIEDYADSLAKALTKPIRKLGDEATIHMAKIRRYGPETLCEGTEYSVDDIPWDSPEVMKGALKSLNRDVILQAYDSLVMKKEVRSRITSFVYGKTFPLKDKKPSWVGCRFTALSLDEIMKKRESLIAYDPSTIYKKAGSNVRKMLEKHKISVQYAATAAALVGVGLWGMAALKGRGEEKRLK